MKNQQWELDDKSDWPDGPWKNEPDKLQWTDPETGLPCLIVRNNYGALCGYVGVDASHPWHEVSYGDLPKPIEVHGGLTFSDRCHEGGRICHKTEPGDPDPVWWLGFDCSHLNDITPKYLELNDILGPITPSSLNRGTYKDIAYVKRECKILARQVAETNEAK